MVQPRVLAPFTLSVLVAACSSNPAPVAPPPAASSAPVATVAAPPPDVPDMSPAAEPKLLVGIARWKSPTKNVDGALKGLGVGFSIVDEIDKAEGEAAKAIAWDASFDAALALDPTAPDDDPRPFFAASIPVKSFADAKAMHEKKHGPSEAMRGGAVRLSRAKGACVLSPANGDAPARIVCGETLREVEALRPWLTRTLAATPPSSSDLEAELRLKAAKDRFLPMLRNEGAKAGKQAHEELSRMQVSDKELLDAPANLIGEGIRFLEDLDRLQFKSILGSSPPSYGFSATAKFSSNTSWFTTYLTAAAAKPSAPPEQFWHLPKDSFSAAWGRSVPQELLATPKRILSKATAEALGHSPFGSDEKKALQDFVDHIPTAGTFAVSASSFSGKSQKGATFVEDLEAVLQTWSLTGVDVPSDAWAKWLREGSAAANKVMAFAKAKDKDGKKTADMPKVSFSTNAAGFPKGSSVLEIDITKLGGGLARAKEPPVAVDERGKPAKPAKPPVTAAPKTRKFFMVVVPDGGSFTWLAFGQSLADLKKAVAAAHSSGAKEGTLAARTDLEPLKAATFTGGGFIALPPQTVPALLGLGKSHGELPKDAVAAAEKLYSVAPNKFTTPQLLFLSGEAGSTPSIGMRMEVQKGTLEDVVALLNFARTPEGRDLLKQLKK